MLKILILTLCLFLKSLIAEVNGNVDYQLPNYQGWKKAMEMKTYDQVSSASVLYVPDYASPEEATEVFSVHMNSFPISGLDQDSLEQALQMQYPEQQVTVTILECDDRSVIYEWTFGTSSYGLARAFSTDTGCSLVSYQAETKDGIDSVKEFVVQSLKEAFILYTQVNSKFGF